ATAAAARSAELPTAGAALTAAGANLAATEELVSAGSLAGARFLAAGSRPQLGFGPSNLGAARRLRWLLHTAGQFRSVFWQPALVPASHASCDVHGLSTFRLRR